MAPEDPGDFVIASRTCYLAPEGPGDFVIASRTYYSAPEDPGDFVIASASVSLPSAVLLRLTVCSSQSPKVGTLLE